MRIFLAVSSLLFFSATPHDRDLFTAFYPSTIVAKTLETFAIPQEEQRAIVASLSNHELDVLTTVEARAQAMEQNPLTAGKQDIVVQLFNTVVSEIFTDVMVTHGITNQEEISAMIADVHRQKAERFRQCMEGLPGIYR